MMDKDAEFRKMLLATFRIEAQEHLQGLSSGLLELEKGGTPEVQAGRIEAIFREAHSLKGAARAVNLSRVESLCQTLESIFSSLKKKETKPTTPLFDLLQQALDLLGQLLAAADTEAPAPERPLPGELIARLEAAARGGRGTTATGHEVKAAAEGMKESAAESPKSSAAGRKEEEPPPLAGSMASPPAGMALPPVSTETVRVSTAKLSSVLLQAEEMLSAKLAAGQRAIELRSANAAFGVWRKEWAKIAPLLRNLRAVKSSSASSAGPVAGNGRTRALDKVFDFLDWNASFAKTLEGRYVVEAKSAEREGRELGGMVNNLLQDMKKVLMFPFSSLLEILPKIVRDLSLDSGKQTDLIIRGGEIEIDRRILEEMKDPLLHLIRNCIDHGIERPEERERKGKPPHGTITIEVSPKDNNVELLVADDGVGISLARIRSAVVKLGAVPQEKGEELSDQELLPYVFQSGVSTSPIITELSGRGLGLAIVREKVERLGGSVTIETIPDAGTSFRIILPLTVATFRGLLVQAGGRAFVIPTMHVERAIRLNREEIKTVENRETIRWNEKAFSLVRLVECLELPGAPVSPEAAALAPAVILSAAGTRIAFLVDEVVGEQEVLLKNLGPQLSRVRNVAGATVLGSGRVVPILNVPDLLKSAVKLSGAGMGPGAAAGAQAAEVRRRMVMVAEDSITTRILLKNILETAGYDVVTAVDGLDALTRLKSGTFDIVVSDVAMPRMNGFDLTVKIRGDKALTELPVVLVTALESREDRERGIDAGANAYIVKSSFDQSNLLEVMRKLI